MRSVVTNGTLRGDNMAYTGKTKCPKCGKDFYYYCLPYRNNDDDTEEPLTSNPILNRPNKAQMCLEWVDENGIPEYTAHCPNCDRVIPMSSDDAKRIPAFYFEKYSKQID